MGRISVWLSIVLKAQVRCNIIPITTFSEEMVISSFSYWDNVDQYHVRNFADAWKNVLPDHKIIGPDDAAALINHYFKDSHNI